MYQLFIFKIKRRERKEMNTVQLKLYIKEERIEVNQDYLIFSSIFFLLIFFKHLQNQNLTHSVISAPSFHSILSNGTYVVDNIII